MGEDEFLPFSLQMAFQTVSAVLELKLEQNSLPPPYPPFSLSLSQITLDKSRPILNWIFT